MSHKSKKKLTDIFIDKLKGMLSPGRNKHEDKILGRNDKYIYSYETFHGYVKHSAAFAKWCLNNEKIISSLGHKPRTIEDCRPYVTEYLTEIRDGVSKTTGRKLSASTLKLKVSSLAKLFGCKGEAFGVEMPDRKRADITRSRNDVKSDKCFNTSLPRNELIKTVVTCIGARRSELEQVRGEDLIEKNGRYFIHFIHNTKGGKERYAEVIGSEEEIGTVVKTFRAAGEKKVFGKINSHSDIHSYRAAYAKRIYDKYSRPYEKYKHERIIVKNNRVMGKYISRNGKADAELFDYLYKDKDKLKMVAGYRDVPTAYRGKIDKAGIVYDRLALFKTSECLGHNREDVVAGHYLWVQ